MNPYETLTGRKVDVARLSSRQKRALTALLEEFDTSPTWGSFSGWWQERVRPIIAKLAPDEKTKHPLYVIGQDLELRLGIAQKQVAPPDYRDFIVDRIQERFGSRYRFCQMTGIPQAFLSQVLSGQKDFSLDTLRRVAEALDLGLALLPVADLAVTAGSDAAALRRAHAQVTNELAILRTAHDHLRRLGDAKKRRAAIAKERELFEGVLDRVAASLGKLDDRAFGERILQALKQETERLEELIGALRDQIARVVESGSLSAR